MTIESLNLVDEKAINLLAREYNALDYRPRLVQLLQGVYPAQNFDSCNKYDLHKLLNDVLFENYSGEEILKYKLFQKYYRRQDIVAAFEIKVNNSRADFLTINGHTKSFEIKSELDNLSKLRKQCEDYMLAFEYNYLVTDEKHYKKAIDILPASFGLWSYKDGSYTRRKKAELNDKINPEVQLRLLTKKERGSGFPKTNGFLQEILNCYGSDSINEQFKQILKDRYRNRWKFLLDNASTILPIDIQFFFNLNVRPSVIYNN